MAATGLRGTLAPEAATQQADCGMMREQDVLREFAASLKRRFAAQVPTTEDSVRYTFFWALLNTAHLEPENVVLEFPHPSIPRARVDAVIKTSLDRRLAVEFKYQRENDSGAAVPRPQNAGALFADMHRLSLVPPTVVADRWMVYCTDQVMARYLRQPGHGHDSVFDMPLGRSVRVDENYLRGKPVTFQRALGEFAPFNLRCLWREPLPGAHELRVFAVESL